VNSTPGMPCPAVASDKDFWRAEPYRFCLSERKEPVNKFARTGCLVPKPSVSGSAWFQGISPLKLGAIDASICHVNRLTRHEQIVLCVVIGLLLTGWAVKSYREAHPPSVVNLKP
jgi:hypothetical protein